MRTARLVGLTGTIAGVTFDLDCDEFVVGRSRTSNLVVPDTAVSRRHCHLLHEADGGYRIVDLESRHGTRINGQVTPSHVLRNQDRIGVGGSEFLYVAAGEAVPDAALELEDTEVAGRRPRILPVSDALFSHPETILAQEPGGESSERLNLDALSRMSAAVSSVSGVGDLARRVLELTFEVIPAERGGLLLVAAPRSGDEITADNEADFSHVFAWVRVATAGPQRVAVSRTVARRVVRERVALLHNDAHVAGQWAGVASLQEAAVRSILCLPITLFDRVIGVLYLDSSAPEARFNEDHLQLATAIAGLVALPLEHARHGLPSPASDNESRDSTSSGILLKSAVAGEQRAPSAAMRSPGQSPAGLAAVLFQPEAGLHIGAALQLMTPLGRLGRGDFPRRVLIMDYAHVGERSPVTGLTDACLDRLAILPPELTVQVALATAVPSIARLAAVVAAMLPPDGDLDARAWFREVLLAAGLIATGATHAAVEPRAVQGDKAGAGPPMSSLLLARKLATRLNQIQPGICAFPTPLLSGFTSFLSLDGNGLMGASPKGTLFVSDSPEVIAKKIRSAKTDARTSFDPMEPISPEVANLLLLLNGLTGESTTDMIERFRGQGYSAIKNSLVVAADDFLAPIRRRREAIAADGGIKAAIAAQCAQVEAAVRAIAESLARAPEMLQPPAAKSKSS